MAGIYGNHPEDRARERELDRYLDSQQDATDAEIAELAEIKNGKIQNIIDDYTDDQIDCTISDYGSYLKIADIQHQIVEQYHEYLSSERYPDSHRHKKNLSNLGIELAKEFYAAITNQVESQK